MVENITPVDKEVSSSLYIPTLEEMSILPVETLCEKWRANHNYLLDGLEDLPHFGLHGTTLANASHIIESKQAHLELATFYNENVDGEFFLYQLYNMSDYVTGYCRKYGNPLADGSVIVFKLGDKSSNITFEWERLKPGGFGTYMKLVPFTKGETSFFKESEHQDKHLWRTGADFYSDPKDEFDFNSCYKGLILFSNMNAFTAEFQPEVTHKLPRIALRQALIAQYVTSSAFSLLKTNA